eukprot:Nk52_evm1s1450 gene=Nk52_evmTU1s1450
MNSQSEFLRFTCRAGGMRTPTYLDSGATPRSYISERHFRVVRDRGQAYCGHKAVSVQLGNGQSIESRKTVCGMKLEFGDGVSCRGDFLVIPMPIGLDIIVGEDIMKENEVEISFAKQQSTLRGHTLKSFEKGENV